MADDAFQRLLQAAQFGNQNNANQMGGAIGAIGAIFGIRSTDAMGFGQGQQGLFASYIGGIGSAFNTRQGAQGAFARAMQQAYTDLQKMNHDGFQEIAQKGHGLLGPSQAAAGGGDAAHHDIGLASVGAMGHHGVAAAAGTGTLGQSSQIAALPGIGQARIDNNTNFIQGAQFASFPGVFEIGNRANSVPSTAGMFAMRAPFDSGHVIALDHPIGHPIEAPIITASRGDAGGRMV